MCVCVRERASKTDSNEEGRCSTCSVSHRFFLLSLCLDYFFLFFTESLILNHQPNKPFVPKTKVWCLVTCFLAAADCNRYNTCETLVLISPVSLLRFLSGRLVKDGQDDLTGSDTSSRQKYRFRNRNAKISSRT